MSAYSLVEHIALVASRLGSDERRLFDELFVYGLSREEFCEKTGIDREQFARMHRALMRSLCGASNGSAVGAATGAGGAA